MIQPLGILLILVGAMMWHIAAGNTSATDIKGVWKDLLKTIGNNP